MIPGIVQSGLTAIRAFIDTFTRTNNASTLTGTGSKSWSNIRGTWGISSNRASTATAASSYPIAAVRTGATAATAKVAYGATTTAFGWGVTFWTGDSNNWYGAITDRTQTDTITYGTATACYPCAGGYSACGGCGCDSCTGGNGPCSVQNPCVGSPCCSDSTPPHPAGNPLNNGQTAGIGYGCANGCGGPCYWVNNGTCCQCDKAASQYNAGSYQYQTSTTTTTYDYLVRIVKSISGTVSVEASNTYLATTGSSTRYFEYVQVQTDFPSSNSVRVTAKLDSATAASFDRAITTPVKSKSYGIMLYPATNGTQASTVDTFDYTKT